MDNSKALLAQLARAIDLYSIGRGFESYIRLEIGVQCDGRTGDFDPPSTGSTPVTPTLLK